MFSRKWILALLPVVVDDLSVFSTMATEVSSLIARKKKLALSFRDCCEGSCRVP